MTIYNSNSSVAIPQTPVATSLPTTEHASQMPNNLQARYMQKPIAIVGMACRLPGHNNSPTSLLKFLESACIAGIEPPSSRFTFNGHFDGSKKPNTMASPGGMFLEDIDLQDIDAQFFKLSKLDAIAMDPQQRQLLEVVYEGLENAGIGLEKLDGQQFGCFVGSYASDYNDIQSRDPEDRAHGSTIGIGRAMLSNRISHFLNIKGPSMTLDTACSGSLVGVDIACRYLQTGEINGAIIGACNLYLSPEHTMDLLATNGTASPSGKCHTFDAKADGYIKAEAVNMVILKRLNDAIHDRDPIRAIIRGSATNSDGWTAGIASPNSQAQAAAIRQAYANANILDLNSTAYLECHGTGTKAGDPVEVAGIASVFSPFRSAQQPLIVGSIKSNIGHSEPAAGISGLLKAVLALERGIIPGNPTFDIPNPGINFHALKIQVSKATIPWPDVPFRRASVNSFGYGGSNAHVVLDEVSGFLKAPTKYHTSSFISSADDFFMEEKDEIPCILTFSANDEQSLRSYCGAISKHLINPSVSIKLRDLAFTLSERRTRHFHRAYVVTQSCQFREASIVYGKMRPKAPRIAFVFTGQGAQWSQMDELTQPRTAEQLRLPEFSQPLVTALQLAIVTVLRSWGVKCYSVIGHSSGEIAAAAAAGFLTNEEAIKVAYYRGKAPSESGPSRTAVGMLAVGLGEDDIQMYIPEDGMIQIACINSPKSVTLSGSHARIEELKTTLQQKGYFARLLQVDLAYHSTFMENIGHRYQTLLSQHCELQLAEPKGIAMFSTVTGELMIDACDASYWKRNMTSQVLFSKAIQNMIAEPTGADLLIEIGPSGALAGPIAQIKQYANCDFEYVSAFQRGTGGVHALFDVAGKLFILGGSVEMSQVNKYAYPECALTIIDLPNYIWNHSVKYWHESDASKEWRFRKFVHHDLLGSKILGTAWRAPSWRKTIRVQDLPWLKDHRLGNDIVFPAAGYMAMAIEALYQSSRSTFHLGEAIQIDEVGYRLRNVKFTRAMVLDEHGAGKRVSLSLNPRSGTKNPWCEFKIWSSVDNLLIEHCNGLIRLTEGLVDVGTEYELRPLKHCTSAQLWYKAMRDVGYNFGPHFQKQMAIESISGVRQNRSLLSLAGPPSNSKQSLYPMEPACIDACLQAGAPSLWEGNRSSINTVLVPAMIDDLVINPQSTRHNTGMALASAEYNGFGRREAAESYKSHVSVYDCSSGRLLFRLTRLQFHPLQIRESVHTSHTYTHLTWAPDISFITMEEQLSITNDNVNRARSNYGRRSLASINNTIDMIVHKTPNLKVMELNLLTDSKSTWLDAGSLSRSNSPRFHFATASSEALLSAQDKYGHLGNVEFGIVDLTRSSLVSPSEGLVYNLMIVKHSMSSLKSLIDMLSYVREHLCDSGYIVLMNHSSVRSGSSLESIAIPTPTYEDCLQDLGFQNILRISSTLQPVECLSSAYVAATPPRNSNSRSSDIDVHLVHLSYEEVACKRTKEALVRYGWRIKDHQLPLHGIDHNSTVLVMCELHHPVISTMNKEQWAALQLLVRQECKILWITAGSQFKVTRPENALIHGVARTLRAEDQRLIMMTLDVESCSAIRNSNTINQILKYLKSQESPAQIDSEFCEREGIVYVSRVLTDDLMNKAGREDIYGTELRLEALHDHNSCIRLRCEHLGTFDSLQYGEVSSEEMPLEDTFVEIDVHAASLNFKDIAVTLGFVPANEHLLGLEGAGVVRRTGKAVKSLEIGQRVLVSRKGSFANRVQCPSEAVHPLPDLLSFEEGATLSIAYLISIYSLLDLAHVQCGQRVLIHSAAGGVGLAAIQLCQYLGAEIFATVGTDEKKDFLTQTFGIESAHIFSSRSTAFAPMLMSATGGKGVDVILNSLSGDLLDESWRCIADCGTMIEIGKKDIVDRNSLSMEPFNRNASYRAIDMSHDSIPLSTIARLLTQIFKLIGEGYIKPISPIKIFSFSDIQNAFRYMRQGNHIGKIVISDGPHRSAKVPIRSAPRRLILRSDRSYLIIGGLKGLCGSLALFLARHGVRSLAVMSRSGFDDEKSNSVLEHLHALDTKVGLFKGDVANLEDVRSIFRNTKRPIAGVVQGAMVLRDKIFVTMTVEDFHEALKPKVFGTWNLHKVALEQNLSLDFFTLLSSISGVVGQKSQANYAAANVFLDSFSRYRHSLGLPSCTIDLGVIEDVGYISEREALAKRLDSTIWTGINEGLLHKILEFSILQQTAVINPNSASQIITGIPVPQKQGSFLLQDVRFAGLDIWNPKTKEVGNQDESRDVTAFFALLKAKVGRLKLLEATINLFSRQLSEALGLNEAMEPARALSDYGVDSLAAVEFRNWVRLKLNWEVTILEIINAKSLSSLCEAIVERVTLDQGTE